MNFETLSLIGQYLLDNDKKEWADTLEEFIKLYQQMYSSDEDSDVDYSDSEGSAVEETTYTTEDEQGFLSLV
jgi:hypothetical protein